MRTGTIATTLTTFNSASWRKAILLNRSVLLSAWPRYFPRHSFSDLHLIRSPNPADSYWDGEDWKRAARQYHQERHKFR
jgi:pyocin large subunit-like protein